MCGAHRSRPLPITAYGRKEVAAAGEGAPSEQTKTPTADATAQTALPDAAAQTALPDAQHLAAMAQETSDPAAAAKREREAEEAALANFLEKPDPNRAKHGDSSDKPPAAQPTGSGKDKGSAGKGGSNVKPADKGSGKGSGHAAMRPEGKDDECLHFIRLTEEYITDDMSKPYKNSVTERASLLASLASMIQEDQAKTLRLLGHSLKVCQHFAKQAGHAPQPAE